MARTDPRPHYPFLRRPKLASKNCWPVAVHDFNEFFAARYFPKKKLKDRAIAAHRRGEAVCWLHTMNLHRWREGEFCPWRLRQYGLIVGHHDWQEPTGLGVWTGPLPSLDDLTGLS